LHARDAGGDRGARLGRARTAEGGIACVAHSGIRLSHE
jgi:hypothetical protein